MGQARALTTIFHQGLMYAAGDLLEFEGELKGDALEGMEWVTKKTTAAFDKAQSLAQQGLQDTATALRAAYNDLRAQLTAEPSRADLIQRVLDAEAAAVDAEKALAAAQPASDLV